MMMMYNIDDNDIENVLYEFDGGVIYVVSAWIIAVKHL